MQCSLYFEIEIWQDIQGRPTVYESVKRMDIENLITEALKRFRNANLSEKEISTCKGCFHKLITNFLGTFPWLSITVNG